MKIRSMVLLRTAVLLLCLCAGCGKTSVRKEELPPPKVEFVRVFQGECRVRRELLANVLPMRRAELVARVPGKILERCFREGAFVRKNEILFRMERDLYDLSVRTAAAVLARNRASEHNADFEFRRIEKLFEEKIASSKDFDNAQSILLAARADTAAAEAELARAKLNLSYTEIRAPFDGWIGLARVEVGNYVDSPGRVLAVVSDVKSVRVEFDLADAWLTGRFLSGIASGESVSWPVRLKLRNGTMYPLEGKLEFWENRIERSSATLTMQAVFPNPERLLLPGLFVRAELTDPVPEKVRLLDRAALRAVQGKHYVLALGKNDVLFFRPVEVSWENGVPDGFVSVLSGLEIGDRTVLAGNPFLRPGMKVRPVPMKRGVDSHGK